jgi:hypothetical protein
LPPSSDIVLHISPAAGSAIFGYILIAKNECHQEKAISAYLKNAGREVTILPCPNFAKFLVDHSLQERNISLIIDLPRYIIPARIFILQANEYSALPNKELLPAPPDLSSFNALSQHSSHRSSLSLHALLSRRDAMATSIWIQTASTPPLHIIPSTIRWWWWWWWWWRWR